MTKVGERYLGVNPWNVVENSFRPERGRVSESIFSLANEYMGVRGYFEEGYSGDRLLGSYFNGFYEETPVVQPAAYKGLISHSRFMINTIDWLYTRILLDGETLDLAKSKFTDFQRVLDFKTGTLYRVFIWQTQSGKLLKIAFWRLLSMVEPNLGCQRITLTPLNFSGPLKMQVGLDFSPLQEGLTQNFWSCQKRRQPENIVAIVGKTNCLGHQLFSAFTLKHEATVTSRLVEDEKYSGLDLGLELSEGQSIDLDKIVTNYADKSPNTPIQEVWEAGMNRAIKNQALTFKTALEQHASYWTRVWQTSDITIEGDPENQQGIRFGIFQLHQTFHGADSYSNIGAKGLTGEAYNGHTFWDTETYCLPFYMFNNVKAARNLLEFRYRTLPKARERAQELDCRGAFYPIATIDGTEGCGLWQHASLQLQVGSAVAYGIWHYVKICNDDDFLYEQGIEMLIEISRCFASRGQWGSKSGEFGFYGVMGPDEFQMMVNNNCYVNFMAKKAFEFTLRTLKTMEISCPELLSKVKQKTHLQPDELKDWQHMAGKMRLPQDPISKVYEEHDGFFDMPHINIQDIPVSDFPLYRNWSYDRIYRYDLIKQPDVLMFMFLYDQEFPEEVKRANYEYYEPRCIHESSLSPSIHSILAMELGKYEEAYNFFQFATRMDLDDYNRNTREGLHTTSIAAAWMNIVYGFGGMRTDGEKLAFKPGIPQQWCSYSFRVLYHDAILCVTVDQVNAEFKIISGLAVTVEIYGKLHKIDLNGIKLAITN
ncbi:MAG TPA: family 65 glycosyl hydrolase [Firmicutes bacterium]|jgi:maltose phosphorylase|nr:family 65 glycosyl hydrolase [Bacillota bacterium]